MRVPFAVAAVVALLAIPPGPAAAQDKKRDIAAIENELVADAPAVRAKAAAELADRFPEGAVAVPMLVELLDDEAPEVVAAAANSIDALGVAAFAPLIGYCSDANRYAPTSRFANGVVAVRTCGNCDFRIEEDAAHVAALWALDAGGGENAAGTLIELHAFGATNGETRTLWASALALGGLARAAERTPPPAASPARTAVTTAALASLKSNVDLRSWVGATLLAALRCREEAVLRALADRLPDLPRSVDRDDRPRAPITICRALGSAGFAAVPALPALRRFLETRTTPSEETTAAVSAILAIDPQADLDTVRRVDSGRDFDLAYTLARAGYASPAVLARLTTREVIGQCLNVIEELGPRAFGALPNLLLDLRRRMAADTDAEVARCARAALAISPGDPQVLAVLAPRSDRVPILAEIAAHAEPSAGLAARLAAAIDANDGEDQVARDVDVSLIEGLARCGADAAIYVPQILERLRLEDRLANGYARLDACADTRRAIVAALARMGPPAAAARNDLTALRDGGDATIRALAAQALRRIAAKK